VKIQKVFKTFHKKLLQLLEVVNDNLLQEDSAIELNLRNKSLIKQIQHIFKTKNVKTQKSKCPS
jgi:hypothetical protein